MDKELDLNSTRMLDRAGITTDTDSGTEKFLAAADKIHKKLTATTALHGEKKPCTIAEAAFELLPRSIQPLAAKIRDQVQHYFDKNPHAPVFEQDLGNAFGSHGAEQSDFSRDLKKISGSDRNEYDRYLLKIVDFLQKTFSTASVDNLDDVPRLQVWYNDAD